MIVKMHIPVRGAGVATLLAALITGHSVEAFVLSPASVHPVGRSTVAGPAARMALSARPVRAVAPVMSARPFETSSVASGYEEGRKRSWARGQARSRSNRPLHETAALAVVESKKDELKLVEGFGKGIASDLKSKAPYYISDIKDGLSIKVLSSTFFLFFACLAPAVAFGGLLGTVTAGAMGTIEMIAATAVCGIIYAAFSGQPLTIIGSTGPVLAFIAVLYKAAARMNLPFLPLYTWVGLWTSGLLGLCSLFSVSNMVLFFTRFTDEIFSLLISVIFIMEATKDITGVFTTPGVPLVMATSTLVVSLTTYVIATTLKSLRSTPFFNKPTREIVADFGPTIGVATGTFAAIWAKNSHALFLPTLKVPLALTTTVGRPWLVPLMTLPVWARWAAFLPALMSTVLLFMDQNITVRLVNSKQHKLKKGFGMNLDMGLLALLTAGCSMFGLPWLVAATVRSLAHVKSLTNYEQLGGGKERIVGIEEQRVSGIAIHTLIGLAVLRLRPLLAQIPLPVTTGLFLYLGVSGLKGNEMWDRTKLLITDKALRPKAPWTNRVSPKKTNIYTLIQLSCLASMMWVKGSPIGVLFPVLIAFLAPLRVLLVKMKLFSEQDMESLDME